MFLIVSKIAVPKGFRGLTSFPFIFLKYKNLKNDAIFINHEKIHLRQQIELLVLPFYILYFSEYLLRLWQYKNNELAYYNISFEREAYQNEENLQYLKKRKIWTFLKYLKNKK